HAVSLSLGAAPGKVKGSSSAQSSSFGTNPSGGCSPGCDGIHRVGSPYPSPSLSSHHTPLPPPVTLSLSLSLALALSLMLALLLPSVTLPCDRLSLMLAVKVADSVAVPSVAVPSVALALTLAAMHASSDCLNTAPSSTHVPVQPDEPPSPATNTQPR